LAKLPMYAKLVSSFQEKLKEKLLEIRKNDLEIEY